jgi:hypothetical protein
VVVVLRRRFNLLPLLVCVMYECVKKKKKVFVCIYDK